MLPFVPILDPDVALLEEDEEEGTPLDVLEEPDVPSFSLPFLTVSLPFLTVPLSLLTVDEPGKASPDFCFPVDPAFTAEGSPSGVLCDPSLEATSGNVV